LGKRQKTKDKRNKKQDPKKSPPGELVPRIRQLAEKREVRGGLLEDKR
jgi:hypothetical protein